MLHRREHDTHHTDNRRVRPIPMTLPIDRKQLLVCIYLAE
ncbi:hypothetical protein RHOER0001_0577 [Rhodococcus erythropolis SK121]|nr:hypothetical protein RHOER0001_0577 [Rhodococcus erythropolis SK121]